ncbi:suppressor of fused domain protein [Crossiella sp. CA-258035]|uniref:suppressor of fused domain protein n=1 Tax=Crossiella sp. CA-258035 TaxID=2981138 RepID=UPI0024BC57E7|nr:suppressor of fused domain protein [Crossiella sp. CA-258035]WHT20781.1 suppressor of fused domain protein [Crossiella sp. CA-258035]
MQLIRHLERHLGPPEHEWDTDDTGTPMPFRIVRFGPDRPFGGVRTHATIGLSAHRLDLPGGWVWQELVMHTRDGELQEFVPALLDQVGAELLGAGAGLARGQVIGPRGQIFPVDELTAFYAALPVYLPDEFRTVTVGERPVQLTWLIPITSSEAEFAQRVGWAQLEKAFENEDPDLTDFHRRGVSAARQFE